MFHGESYLYATVEFDNEVYQIKIQGGNTRVLPDDFELVDEVLIDCLTEERAGSVLVLRLNQEGIGLKFMMTS